MHERRSQPHLQSSKAEAVTLDIRSQIKCVLANRSRADIGTKVDIPSIVPETVLLTVDGDDPDGGFRVGSMPKQGQSLVCE